MNSTDWNKIKKIYNDALDLPSEERADFLARAEEPFRSEAEKLLCNEEKAISFIPESAFVDVGIVAEEPPDFYIGRQIDEYTILDEIGRGGMGTVYLAAHTDPTFTKKVAIKLIKRGMDTASVLKRFVIERWILASLENPNIASLLGGGSTAEGLPYLVMEYIEGVPVTKFCEQNDLSVTERLQLFRKVCSAISYAHQNLVVHRDIKPSNILVTAGGTPKILDFGIAKLLRTNLPQETSGTTANAFRLMTPEYASPEQIRGQKISTASDIYSLGIVLYELLSGERPYRIESQSSEEVIQMVLTEEPMKPSAILSYRLGADKFRSKSPTGSVDEEPTNEREQLIPRSRNYNPKSLRGDLDNIILKALRKEPERRYQSVQEFAEDILRHLEGMPVTATADSRIYRAGKFLKRHKIGALVSLLFVVTLLSATAVTTWQSVVAGRERERADQRFNQVRKLANIILFDYHDRIKNLPGATETRKKLVTDALEYLDNLAQNSDDSPELQRELVTAYQKVAEIQSGSAEGGNTGERGSALENYGKAMAIQESLVWAFPENDSDRRKLANLYATVGDITADLPKQEYYCRKAVEILIELVEKDSTSAPTRADLANARYFLATAIRGKGNYDEAIDEYRRAGEIYEELVLIDEGSERRAFLLRRISLTYKTTGAVFEQKMDSDAALELYRKALPLDLENAAANPNNVQHKLDSAFTYNSIASALTNLKNYKEARENCQKALAIQEKVVADDPSNAFAKYAVARTFRRMGDILQFLEMFDEAAEHYEKSIRRMEELVRANPINDGQKARLAELYSVFGDFLFKSAFRKKHQKLPILREAETFQKRGIELFTNLKSGNKLSKANELILTEAQGNLQKTEAELAKLR